MATALIVGLFLIAYSLDPSEPEKEPNKPTPRHAKFAGTLFLWALLVAFLHDFQSLLR